MAKNRSSDIEIKAYSTHHVIVQPNPLRTVLRRVGEDDPDDPVAEHGHRLGARPRVVDGDDRAVQEDQVGRQGEAPFGSRVGKSGSRGVGKNGWARAARRAGVRVRQRRDWR